MGCKGSTAVPELCQFLQVFFLRLLAPDSPLTAHLKKGITFKQSQEAQMAFETLKGAFTSVPILVHPDPTRLFIIEADSSSSSDKVAPLCLLTPDCPHKKWQHLGLELLAIKVAFEKWQHLLEGDRHPIQVITDHKNLEYLQMNQKLSPWHVCWSLLFSHWNFIITYWLWQSW